MQRKKNTDQKSQMSPEQKEVFFAFVHICHERHVPLEEKYQWMKEWIDCKTDGEKISYWEEKIEYIKNTYSEIPMEQFLKEVNASSDWQTLKQYDDLYWQNIEDLLLNAVRLSAVNVIELVAPHILFGNERLLKEYCDAAPDDAVRRALEKSFMKRHDEDYEQYPFSWVWNKQVWNHRENFGAYKLISIADETQESLWRAFLNRYSSGSELLFYEHMTAKYAVDREYTGIDLDREIASHSMHDMGYEVISDGFEKKRLPRYWFMKSFFRNPNADMYYGAVGMTAMMRRLGWAVQTDMVSNEYGTTGYAYLKQVPHVEKCIFAEDRILSLFHAAFNGKIKWRELKPVMSENCHYYSDGSKKDITGREEIVSFWESIKENQRAAEVTQHAHYARLKKPVCDPELLEHKEGERIIAIWQEELGEWYEGHLFFRINDDGLVDDIYLCQDNRYRFRPFIPIEEEE